MSINDLHVIVIGADHHNTLAVVRALGSMKVDINILIHCADISNYKARLAYSKFANNRVKYINENEEDICKWLCNNSEIYKRWIVFPCSDLASYTLDFYYQELKDKYIMPGFIDSPGFIVKYMDKFNQKKFADKYDIAMAKTWSVNIDTEYLQIPDDIVYPCIVKPEVSAKGKKSDITICKSYNSLVDTLIQLQSKRYKSLIIQQFLKKEYEVCAYGCIIQNNENRFNYGGIIKKVREYPPHGGGSLTLAQFIDDSDVKRFVNNIIHILYGMKYTGQYDIELLVCKDGIYLNEINFRHSGNGYALIQNGLNAPYIWCLSRCGFSIPENIPSTVDAGLQHMDEISDFIHRKANNISLIKWIRDLIKTSAFAVFDVHDIRGSWGFYRYHILHTLKRINH